ncbi:hypothetical protein EJ05DRAFT_139342 [Pseudovirgaria hyperparasitica]|uniref:BZIP domain-containing protein n=1 Tax=Pseudovirgaria hyperparasitica TaxID=470096 RepID=A0A6A6VX40_9PEZI|nr:uncharacterized protein EJ05DRAFT_139342 [Pseudovirgaria hyperparasitica]KAF2754366.1 hypothetical protein EJ05DRAFT_139342 [Pseudovirgaria hyperparasitica]
MMASLQLTDSEAEKACRGECWHGVQDARERKRIRKARFKALAQHQHQQHHQTPNTSEVEGSKDGDDDPFCHIMDTLPPLDPALNIATYSPSEVVSSKPEDMFAIVPPTLDPSDQVAATALPAHYALFLNGDILGLTCGMSAPSRSLTPIEIVPASLYPSMLQLVTVHKLWIDRFPFPRFRENMLNLSPVIDDEQFLRDLFGLDSGKSFCVREGGMSWEPRDWFMGKQMSEKWGWLFY